MKDVVAHTVELNTDGTPRTPGPDPLIGKELLHYKVIEIIGQGGMSVVYRGHDHHLHRDVAIKVLHPFLAEKAECRARLAREARAVARLEHPHILKVFDFSGEPATIEEKPGAARFGEGRQNVRGFAEGFIVAELVRGPTLKRFAEEHEVWSCPEVGAMITWQIGTALQHAHDHGVVHRDLKPENVMVREDGWLKLMDFGIAHIADQKGLTVTGTLLGSPAHMAPECIDGFAADEKSDVFSLGTVLYWLTTGWLPFEALTPHALLKQIVEGKAVPAQQRSPRISDDLARVIARAMATRPADRYPTAAAFVAGLEEVLEKAGVPASPDRLRAILGDMILGNPARQLAQVATSVRAAFLKRAEQHLEGGAPARALSCLNRVLAEDKDDADARALLERAQGDIEEEPPEEPTDDDGITPLVTSGSSGAGETSPTAVTAALSATGEHSQSVPAPPLGRLARQAALVGIAAALIAGSVLVATRFDDDRAPIGAAAVAPAGDDDGNSGTSTGDPAALEPRAPPADGPAVDKGDKKKRDRDAKRDVGKLAVVEPPRVEPPKDPRVKIDPTAVPANPTGAAPGADVLKRTVTLRVKPWADMFVDGKQVAKGSKKAEVELAPGPHTVTFRNPGAKEAEVKVDVLAQGPLPEIAVELEPKPAYLVVTCNVPDAFVSVNGQGGKSAASTADAALMVPLGGSSASRLEVIVHKKGYGTWLRRVPFQAGQTLKLDVVLEPQSDGVPVAPGGERAPREAGSP